MPNWARLPSTRKDTLLRDRMTSAFENGCGDVGPLAIVLSRGGCFLAITLGFLLTLGIFAGFGYGLWWIGHRMF